MGVTWLVSELNQNKSPLTFSRIIPLAYSIILLALALYKAVEYWRMSAGFKGFALVKVLVQDQIIYFWL